MLTHGIVTDHAVCFYVPVTGRLQWNEYPIRPAALSTMGDYIRLANELQLQQLWILPGTVLSDSFSSYDDTFVTSCLDQFRIFPTELESYLVGRDLTKPGSKEVTFVNPAYIKGLPMSVTHMGDAKNLYAYVAYLQSLLGCTFKRDAKGTGIELLYQVNTTKERRGTTQGIGYIRPIQSDVSPFYDHKSVDISWSRYLLPDETSYRYFYSIDRNLMYLAATSGLLVGSGNYLHMRVSFDKKQPGCWLARLTGETVFNTGLYPPVFPSYGWLDTAMVQAAIETGYQVTIEDAYIFPEAHTVFNPWYNVLRKMYNTLLTDTTQYRNVAARTACMDTLKKLYKEMIGLLDRRPDKGEKDKWYNRPDMYNAIVGESVRRMVLTLRELAAADIHVVGVNVDEIFIVSNQPLDQGLPASIVLSQQVGKFKVKANYPLAEVSHFITDRPHTLIQGLAREKHKRLHNG